MLLGIKAQVAHAAGLQSALKTTSEHAEQRISMRLRNALLSADPGVQPWPAGLWRPRGPAVAGSSDLGLAAVGERQWSWPEPGIASGALRH